MKQDNPQKIKLLVLLDYLKRETDEQHPISRQELCRVLNEKNISSNPRTLSLDIALLNESGYEIMSKQIGHEKYYYVEDRKFNVPELKILIDAIEAASFISDKKTDELIDKIASMGGIHRAEILKRDMVYFNTRKHTNESVLYSIDRLEDAISRKKKVSFFYFDLDEKAQRQYRSNGTGDKKRYYVEPVALIFNEDNYYLMAYSSRHPDATANYRIDRMDQVEVVEESVLSEEAIAKIEGIAEYTGQAFKMHNGKETAVTLEFDKSLIGSVLDKFGETVKIKPTKSDNFRIKVSVQISPTFFGWLAQFGNKMRIVSPDNVIERYHEHIRQILG